MQALQAAKTIFQNAPRPDQQQRLWLQKSIDWVIQNTLVPLITTKETISSEVSGLPIRRCLHYHPWKISWCSFKQFSSHGQNILKFEYF